MHTKSVYHTTTLSPLPHNRFKSAALTAMLACLILAGCKVGPDYHKPKESLPIGWKQVVPEHGDSAVQSKDKPTDDKAPAAEKEKATLDKKALSELEWWKQFHDPVLDGLITKGLDQNLDLKIAEARIKEARSAITAAKADLLPTVNIMANGTREANQVAFGSSSFPKPFNVFETGFDASWEIDVFGGNRRALESVFALFKSVNDTRDDVRVSLLAEIARTYMNVRRYQAEVALADNTVKAQQETLKIKQELLKVGSIQETDVIPVQSQLMQAQAQVLMYQNMLATSEYAMDLLLAENPGTSHDLLAEIKPVPVADKNLVLAAPAEVMENRPDVRSAEHKYASSVAEIGVAKAKLFPEISISAFFGVLSTSTDNLISAQNKSWTLGGNLLWPILNYGRISANIDSAKAQEKEALLVYKKSVIAALVDVESSLSSYTKQEQSRVLMDKVAEQNKHATDIMQMRYKSGLVGLSDVLDAQKTYYAAQIQSVDATANSSQDYIAVYKSLGGGWKNAPAPVAAPVTEKVATPATPAPAPQKK